MTYDEIVDAVIEQRFNQNARTRVKRWVNARYMAIWNSAEWRFRRVTGASLAITAADASPTMPSDFSEATTLFNEDGFPISFVEPDVFRRDYASRTDSGAALAFTVLNGALLVAPAPDTARTYTLDYRRRIVHLNGAGAEVAGLMSDDDDRPVWPEEHDELLIVDTLMYGMTLGNDSTWRELKEARSELYDALADACLEDRGGTTREYGADTL